MKKLLLGLIMSFGFLLTHAQNEKNIVVDDNAEVRSVGLFTGIEVSGSIDLYLSQGSSQGVAISASSDDIKQRIKTEVKNGILQIYVDGKGLNWKNWGNNRMKAYVTFISLSKIEASGACNVKVTESIKSPELKIEMSGASDFSGSVNVEKLRIEASGASNIKISGTTQNVSINASGACSIRAYELNSEICQADASGASNIKITVNKELNANASGGSDILFKGSGLIRNISSGGGASVKRSNND